MNLLANVNVPKASVDALRLAGHDVVWALDQMATDPDYSILEAAQKDKRILLTNDKDFGELAFHSNLPAECGVILLRFHGLKLSEVVTRTVVTISSRDDWAGHFAVVDPFRIRIRPLPKQTES